MVPGDTLKRVGSQVLNLPVAVLHWSSQVHLTWCTSKKTWVRSINYMYPRILRFITRKDLFFSSMFNKNSWFYHGFFTLPWRIIHPRYPDDWAKDGLRWEGLQWNLDLGGWQDHRPATWFNTSKRGGRWCVSIFFRNAAGMVEGTRFFHTKYRLKKVFLNCRP